MFNDVSVLLRFFSPDEHHLLPWRVGELEIFFEN